MDDTETTRQLVSQFWAAMQTNDWATASALFADDYVLFWPQSGERISGAANFVAINSAYPAAGRWRFTVERLVVEGEQGQADADDEKLKLMLRPSEGAPLEPVLNPNTWSSDEALVFAVPSPDGALAAFGTSLGSTHDAQIRVLDVATGGLLADRPRGTMHASVAWRPDSSGFLYSACPRARRGARGRRGALERDLRASHRLKHARSSRLRR